MTSVDNKKLIMVVDDDATVRFMSRSALEQRGFAVVEFADGELALEAFPKLSPSAVMLDVGLPGMDGYSVCELIRSHPHGQLIPIMMLTGLKDIDSINRAYEVGATDFETKPMNWSLLPYRMFYLIRSNETLTELHRSRMRLLNAKKIADISDWEFDIENEKIDWSNELYDLLARDKKHKVSQHQDILSYIHKDDLAVVTTAVDSLFRHHKGYELEYRIQTDDQKVIYVHERTRVIHDTGGMPVCLSGTLQDISKRKQAEEEIHYLAYYDLLTGLANRTLFTDHLRSSIERAKRNGSQLAVLFLDIDNFKRINDSLGHDAGDQLLRKVSTRLQKCLQDNGIISRESLSEYASVARFGGDEFIVLLEDCHVAAATHLAQGILQALGPNITINYHEVPLSASIGIAMYPDNGGDDIQLLKNADAAMFRAKECGKNNFRFYDKSMNELALRKLRLERDLQSAISNNELFLLYQPKIHVPTQRIVGAESLIRWNHPNLGLISPVDFIPMAEENHLIQEISHWVIEQACWQIKRFADNGHDLHIAVNLSAGDFADPKLIDFIHATIDRTQINPQYLEIELTERLLMQDLTHTMQTLDGLKALGVKLAIDDFGTGYSSLRYLSQFPLDTIKIDQSFVANLPDNQSDAMITEAIIGLAHNLELNLVAEGIERQLQCKFLLDRQCEVMQGYLFSKPITEKQLHELLVQPAFS